MASALRSLLAVVAVLCFAATEITGRHCVLPVSLMRPPIMSIEHHDSDSSNGTTSILNVLIITLGLDPRSMADNGINDSAVVPWNGPFTVFFPTNTAFPSNSSFQVLIEHIVPGLFSASDLFDLAPDSRIETMNPGYCIAVTSSGNRSSIFISGVRISLPDMFNNGLMIVHILDGYVYPLSPLSCSATSDLLLPLPPAFPTIKDSHDELRSPAATSEITGRHSVYLPVSLMRPPIMSIKHHDIDSSDRMTSILDKLIIKLRFLFRSMADNGINDSTVVPWNGPFTVFFPTNTDFPTSSNFQVLIEHIVPGLFSASDLFDLAPDSRIETMHPGYCIAVTSSRDRSSIFISGVRILWPDTFNNGLMIVHYLDGYIYPLSPWSCSVTSDLLLPFPPALPTIEDSHDEL